MIYTINQMGIRYSKIICADPKNKCAQQPPIYYPVYSENIKDKTQEQIQRYVCGNKTGQIYQCCDPLDRTAGDIVKDANLIKVIRDDKGMYREFQVCRCESTDTQCEQQYCKDPEFKRPTQYEFCRARAVNKQDEIPVSDKVYRVVAANTYTNCYLPCKQSANLS